MSDLRAGFVLGFHGCSRAVADRLLAGADFEESAERHDWLGPGAYFWEGDARRAREWAEAKVCEGRYDEAAVVGAVIDLGRCLDLTVRENLLLLADAHADFEAAIRGAGLDMPRNKGGRQDTAGDKPLRNLDCAVITYLHESIADGIRGVAPFDTVRGMFHEGEALYPGGGFYSHTHTQIAVRDQTRIKGVFRPRGDLAAFTDGALERSAPA